MLNVICSWDGDSLGKDYVLILRDMVIRNLPEGTKGRFICFTDKPDDLGPHIEKRPLPVDFAEFAGQATLRLPLECLVTGPLDRITRIALPSVSMDSLRAAFPGEIVDYSGPFHRGAKIVLFPDKLPHECNDWVRDIWKIGGATSPEFVFDSNVSQEQIVANIVAASKRPGVAWADFAEPHDRVGVIVAGGPSLRRGLGDIAALQEAGAKVFAVNRVPEFLLENGMTPDAHVLLEGIPDAIEFVNSTVKMERYYSSQCDPSVLDAAGDELVLWTPYIEGIDQAIPDLTGALIGGGVTVGTRAIGLLFFMGYRTIHIFGLDSSCEGDAEHAYGQIEFGRVLDVVMNGKKYRAPPQMIAQVEDFKNMVPDLLAEGCELVIHGSGLLPDVAAQMLRKAA